MDNQINATVINEQVLNTLKPSGGKKKIFLAVFILSVVILIIIGGYYIYDKYNKSVRVDQLINSDFGSSEAVILPLGDAELSLIASSNKYPLGGKVPIDIELSTTGRIVSRVEISIKYDPAILTIDEKPFTNGTIFSKEPVVARGLNKNLIRITGDLGTADKGYSGTGILGTLNLVAKKEGVAILSIELPTSTTKGSMALNLLDKKNVLGKAYGIEITVNRQ